MNTHLTKAWGILWRSENQLDGKQEYLVGGAGHPVSTMLFHTRAEARKHIEKRYGYFRKRPDLQNEPHGWKMPQAVRVEITIKSQGAGE